MSKKFLRVGGVAAKLSIGVSSVWRLAQCEPGFPKPIKLSQRVTVWDDAELDAYMTGKTAERRLDEDFNAAA